MCHAIEKGGEWRGAEEKRKRGEAGSIRAAGLNISDDLGKIGRRGSSPGSGQDGLLPKSIMCFDGLSTNVKDTLSNTISLAHPEPIEG